MADDLEERLKSHARAFEGLMSLIPAKHYYGEDTSDQWQRKKQTKEQKREAKRAKLDPANQKSAKDVMDENERKRKREMEGDDDVSDVDAPGKEKPGEGLKGAGKKAKKQKLDDGSVKELNDQAPLDEAARKAAQAEKRKEKQQQKKEKKAKQQEKAEAKKAYQEVAIVPEAGNEEEPHGDAEVADNDEAGAADIDHIDVSGIVEDTKPTESQTSASPSPPPDSPASAIPSASSSSSILPPPSAEAASEPSEKPSTAIPTDTSAPRREKTPKLPPIDQELLKARLQARIDALRAARKADGIDGKPARNRQELLEARRRKEELRKSHKKEVRARAKEDEQRAAAEAELARLRGSGSPLTTPDIFSPRSPERNNFSFGRVTFDDGMEMDASMSNVMDARRKKGPQDPKTALDAAKRKEARINSFDEEKRKDIAEKDLWLNAKKRAHGERVRDDTSLLKKTLKRKEKQKEKSEKAWGERIEGVKKGQEIRQKKREENLKKRKEEKGSKGKKGKGKKPKGRPGFEGSFRSKAK
ncbi:hypothetical protein H2201_002088 [Coniosporium apollinis]|uniref:Ribosomal RNA-processing protein 14/surfeit locus protein 6 C-terminal domain-containing protein n=1 Tax=Coniosporium apollinis TaxID=61459 RepID=A0ABQ9P0H8_9PEZI|nr:hypothetical protein H2201_002088 [Coniosporium apollinis]